MTLVGAGGFGSQAAIDRAQELIDTLTELGITPGEFAATIYTAANSFGGRMAEIALPILGFCIAVRLVMIIVKELLDGDIVELVGEVFFTLLLGLFLTLMIQGWTTKEVYSIPMIAEELMQSVMAAASPEAGGGMIAGMAGVFGPVITSLMGVLGGIWDIVALSFEELEKAFVDLTTASGVVGTIIDGAQRGISPVEAMAASAGGLVGLFQVSVMNLVLGVLATIAVVIVFCLLLYHMLSGFITFQIVVAFGPLTLAAYPLVDQWAKKALSAFAGAIVQMAAAILLISFLDGVLSQALDVMQRLLAAP